MGLNKESREVIIKELKEDPIWLLEMKVARQNKLLIALKSQGVISTDNKWRKICSKRNIIRKMLFDKIGKLYKGELRESNPTYSDYLTYEELKKNG